MRAKLAFLLFGPLLAVLPSFAAESFTQPATSSILVSVEDGSTVAAAKVESWPQGFVKLTKPDGDFQFLEAASVLSIRDSEGNNWTETVLKKKGSVGDAPPQVFKVERPSGVLIQARGDSTVTVARIERWPQGFVKVTYANGAVDYVSVEKVQWIRDAAGHDRTRDVLDHGQAFGEAPEAPVQLRASPAPHGLGTLRGMPKPYRNGFPILQAGTLVRLGTTGPGVPKASMVMDVGGMKNLSRKYSMGASLYAAEDDDWGRVGIKARVRRWMSKDVSVDLAPGLLVHSSGSDQDRSLPAFVGEASLGLWDRIVITGQVERSTVTRYEVPHGEFLLPYPIVAPKRERGTETSYYLGAKFGAELGLPGMFLGVLTFAFLTQLDDMSQP